METNTTSKKIILKICEEMVIERGISSINMRAVAKSSGVSLGLLYYYFQSKDELLIQTIESVWENIFNIEELQKLNLPFHEFIENLFNKVKLGMRNYPNFYTMHSLSFANSEKENAAKIMDQYLVNIKKCMLTALQKDVNVNMKIFSEIFTEVEFIEFVLSNIMNLLLQKNTELSILLEVIRRTIYCGNAN